MLEQLDVRQNIFIFILKCYKNLYNLYLLSISTTY
jgi:hypothetical protein